MRKNFSKIMLSLLTVVIAFSLIGAVNVMGVEGPDQTIEVQGDTIQLQLQSHIRTMLCFRERTRLTICTNTGLDLDVNCEALRIGEKDVIIEVVGDNDHKMTMTCTREETQLGLMNGSLHRVRNRDMYRYLEGFCISMACSANCNCECECQCKCDPECTCPCECECKCDPECTCPCECECKCDPECTCPCECECKCDPECTCPCECECKCDSECPYDGNFLKARLRIRATNQNRLGQWAYHDNENNEWVTVSTTIEDGYLTTETTILSTWTLLIPVATSSAIEGTFIIVGLSIIELIAILGFYLKRRH